MKSAATQHYTTLLLDNDGTLVDSETLSCQSFINSFDERSCTFTAEHYGSLILRDRLSLVEVMQHFDIAPRHSSELKQRIDDHFVALLAKQCQLMPKVKETLAMLHPHYRLVVVTGANRMQFNAAHSNQAIRHFFDRIFTIEDYPKEKPDPAPYLTALSQLSLKPSECLAVEDTSSGLASATAAGIDCAVIPHDLTHQHDFAAAKWQLRDFSELARLLERCGSR